MNKSEIHYLTCQSENCEKYMCVARRDYEQKILCARGEALNEAAELFETNNQTFTYEDDGCDLSYRVMQIIAHNIRKIK